ncbi:Short-chain dehydrogenase/reductase sat3 [Pyricularia grisea]|uniref:Uncharacterized protein n=1 Tax=Pyricularia grisea TaxID=148305 RepID=A0A6P8BHL7_PYRGI|nr:uncharacterized protein PgNI_00621 [Pyricularia grisea]KAI6355459.1 Short-chain dehydrogenase/reductase sat3 [Pyricularia grisea]TLD16371.1 hypothetical protein PgNI_00621 [Pyricularia grisea]
MGDSSLSATAAATLFRVDGIVAVITGGGTGIGLMMTKALVKNGAKKVYILGRRVDVLEKAVEECGDAAKGVVVPVQCDVTSKQSIQGAVDVVTSEVGYANLVVANSGAFGPPNRYDPTKSISELRKTLFDDVDMDEVTQTFHINVTGAYFTMLGFLELLDAGNKSAVEKGTYGAPVTPGGTAPSIQSQVVFNASVAGYLKSIRSPPSYGGSKAALLQLTKVAATMLATYGIRVNGLAPGLFPSELASVLIGERNPETENPDLPTFIPARKFGGDEEMGGTILYLASRAGSYCDGLILVVDGGRLAYTNSTY